MLWCKVRDIGNLRSADHDRVELGYLALVVVISKRDVEFAVTQIRAVAANYVDALGGRVEPDLCLDGQHRRRSDLPPQRRTLRVQRRVLVRARSR